MTAWRMKGKWIKSCNCNWGCPCDFNAPPTHGHCEGMFGMQIDDGHYKDVDLSGLRWFVLVDFPGALHEGNGVAQFILDERATPAQREALLRILHGKDQVEGTLFHILSLIVTRFHDPIYAPIRFEFDEEARTARIEIPGVLEHVSEPIRNPVTGAPHRIRLHMPEGFEHDIGEIASTKINRVTAGITFDQHDTHSTLATVEHTQRGVVHPS
jgi:hypothetical protein